MSSSGGAHTSKDEHASVDPKPTKESGGKHRKRESTKPRPTQQESASDKTPTDSDATASDPAPTTDTGPVTPAPAAAVVSVATAAEPVVEPISPNAVIEEPPTETVTAAVATTLLSTVLGGSPDTPTESPAAWVLLAAARRQVGEIAEAKAETTSTDDVTTGESVDVEPAAFSALSVTADAEPQLVVTGSIPVGGNLSGVDASDLGNKLYVANRDADTVTVIDRTTGAVIETIPVGDAPSGVDSAQIIYLPPFGNTYEFITRTFVTNSGSGTVTILNIADDVIATVKVGTNPVAVAQGGGTARAPGPGWSTPAPTQSPRSTPSPMR